MDLRVDGLNDAISDYVALGYSVFVVERDEE